MHPSCCVLPVLSILLTALRPVAAATQAPDWIDQSWSFLWDPPGPFPVPTTAQCQTLNIKATRTTETGPDPVAPFYLLVYTSNFIFPFNISAGSDLSQTSLTIPFAPGTEYQICMFDSQGNTGGCQAVYTVYPNTTTGTASCTNLTMPAKALNVKAENSQGSLSQYGWIDSCSDIRVTPLEGTPPFTFLAAPALHPPVRIVSNSFDSINWTVSLSWASPFFISLVDSTGLSWSFGPLHSGDGKTGCLSTDARPSTGQVSMGVTIGATVGGAVIGSLGALLTAFLLSKRRRRHGQDGLPTPFYSSRPNSPEDETGIYNALPHGSPPTVPIDMHRLSHPNQHSQAPPLPSKRSRMQHPSLTGSIPSEYQIEPFRPPSLNAQFSHSTSGGSDDTSSHPPRQSWHDGADANTHHGSTSPTERPIRQEGNSQVYVIHHDSGRAPVSVITAQGTEIVELPPGYSADYLAAGGSSGSQPATPGAGQRRSGKLDAARSSS